MDHKSKNQESQNRNNHKNKGSDGKKVFDKKTYRLKKYSNKYKVDQFEDRRKKAVLRNFYKDLKKEQGKGFVKPFAGTDENTQQGENSNSKKHKSAFFAAKEEFRKKKNEKQAKREEYLKSKSEREEALTNYREKKKEMYKKLSKKTKKGQPVMKDRLEMLLEKIKESTAVD